MCTVEFYSAIKNDVICRKKMDATRDYPIKWNESASERQTAYVFPHLWILNFMEMHDSSLGGYEKGWKRDFPKE